MAENLRIDHVSLGSRDLDATATWLSSLTGLEPAGAWFFNNGLGNRVVSSGGPAIELLGIAFPGAEMVSALVAQVYGRTIARDRWLTWALSTDDIDATASRLGLDVADGGAVAATGHVIKWRMAGVVEAFFSEPYLPFFLSYTEGMDDWRAQAVRPEPAFDITQVALSGNADRFAGWTDGAALPVKVVDGPPSIECITLSVSGREIEVRPEL